MKHTYKITGMSCDGCRTNVEKALQAINGITKATVGLPDSAILEMDKHIAIETLQEALTKVGNYTITISTHSEKKSEIKERTSCCCGSDSSEKEVKTSCCGEEHQHEKKEDSKQNGNETYYCPMKCEGDKTYDEMGECPKCGMLLNETKKEEK